MPVYEYHCAACKVDFDSYKRLADYKEPQLHSCGNLGQKIISKPMIAVDYPAYQSPATGKWIDGKKAHLEDLKASGCRLFEPGEREDAKKRVVEEDRKLDTFIDNSVEKVFAEIKG
jgi:putative FmdB family regulatory protein